MSRGEAGFAHSSDLAVALYGRLARWRSFRQQYSQIAQDLASIIERGSFLDIGTGPGRLLAEMHKLRPEVELFGLDISQAMIRQARRNLEGIGADLRVGNIRHSDYDSGFFDVVTCTCSFFLWDHPEEGLEEIRRILKAGGSAYLYETHRGYDEGDLQKALRANIAVEGLLWRMFAPRFLNMQLRRTYSIEEIDAIVKRTGFAGDYKVEKITLAGLPIWVRVLLTKKS